MCGRGPPVLCVLVPGDDSQGPLNLWLCLLQSGETALHVAARYGHADVVQLLCSFGSNPNFQDKDKSPFILKGEGVWLVIASFLVLESFVLIAVHMG